MEEERTPRPASGTHRRRLRPGFVLNVICLSIILICFIVGGFQAVAAHRAAQLRAAEEAAALAAQEAEEQRLAAEAAALEASKYDFTLAFMGDLNLADDWSPMQHLVQRGQGVDGCFDPQLLEFMRQADLFVVNNEFAFTDRGTPLAGKTWIIHGKPENVSYLHDLGVDVVTLANNHIYDMGPDGLTDTLTTLDEAGIRRVGAGENIQEASAPLYVELEGQTVAFVDACNAEGIRFTPEATEDSSGVLLCYEYDKFLNATRQAEANADYVIAMVHWGTDYVYETSDDQRDLAHQLIDAGADVVLGAHSHSLQGIEYYNGVPIFYSLGTCWFNNKTLETFMLQLHFQGDSNGGTITPTILPAKQVEWTTRLAQSSEEAQQILNLISTYSHGVHFEPAQDHAYAEAVVLVEGEPPVSDTAETGEDAQSSGWSGDIPAVPDDTADAGAAG